VFANPALKRGVIIDPVHDLSSFDSFCVKMSTPITPRFSVGVIPSEKSGFSPEHERRSGLKPLKTVFANPALKRGVIIDPVYDLSSFDSFCVKISTPITPRFSVGVIPSAKSGFSPERERRSGLKPLKTVFANPALNWGGIRSMTCVALIHSVLK